MAPDIHEIYHIMLGENPSFLCLQLEIMPDIPSLPPLRYKMENKVMSLRVLHCLLAMAVTKTLIRFLLNFISGPL